MASFCTYHQNAKIPQEMEINLYHELYKELPEITIGNRIHRQRLMQGMTQQELADATGLKRGSIDTFEYDVDFPSLNSIKAIAKALNISFSYFEDDYYRFVNDGFPDRFKSWRKSKGLSMRAAAAELGVNVTTLNNWEQGHYIMNRVTFNRCRKFLEEA